MNGLDMEKVVKGLQNLRESIATDFIHEADQAVGTIDDAIALLKDQEPVEPELEGGGSSWWHVCPECHGTVDKGDHFCRHCGQAFK